VLVWFLTSFAEDLRKREEGRMALPPPDPALPFDEQAEATLQDRGRSFQLLLERFRGAV
jgi:hypothetical protein